MSKIILLALWGCLITMAASYGAMLLAAPKLKVEQEATYFGGIDYVKAPLVGVPIIKEKELTGYVVAQFVFTIEQKVMKSLSVPPQPFLVNAAFQRIYADWTADTLNMKKQKVDEFLQDLRGEVNSRYGKEVIKEILIERMNFLPMDAVRSGSYEMNTSVKTTAPAKAAKSGH